MTEKTSNQPLIPGKELVAPSTGGAETLNDLMDGGGDYSLSVNRNGSKNQKINTKVQDIEEDEEELFEKQGSKTDNWNEDMNILQCFWEITKFATPLMFGMLVYTMVMLVNTYYIGHVNDPILLAGVGMGNMLINVLCFAVVQGLNGALETLVSQAYGAGKHKACGIYLNRGKFVATMIFIPIIILYICSEEILVGLHQDRAISHIAKRYCCMLLPGIWAQSMFDATRKFLSAQFVTMIPLVAQCITLVFHFLWCWLFISHLGMRETGAALASNITYIGNMVICDIWCYSNADIRKTYAKPSLDMIKDVGTYLKIGIPGACMICFEWWVFELLAIFSGLMSVDALAAEVIIVNVVGFVFMIPLGTAYAASALTGVFLGEQKIDKAKKYSRYCLVFIIFITVIVLIVMTIFRDGISRIFTHDDGTVSIIMDVFGMIGVYIFFDTIHGVQSGIIRGLGLQVWGAIYTLICYYIVGLPIALYLAFIHEMGVKGLWMGFALCSILLDAGLQCIIDCPDWHKIARKMQTQIDKTQKSKIESTPVARLRGEDFAKDVGMTPEAKRYIRQKKIENEKRSRSNSKLSASKSPTLRIQRDN